MSELHKNHNAKIVYFKGYFIANFEAKFLKRESPDYKFAPNDMTMCYRVYLRDGEIDHLQLFKVKLKMHSLLD